MYFHRIVRLKDVESAEPYISDETGDEVARIFPLVSPESELGQWLLDANETAYIHELSGDWVELIYIDADVKSEYPTLLSFLKKRLEADGLEFSDSVLVVSLKAENRLIVVDLQTVSETRELQAVIAKILAAAKSEHALTEIQRISSLHKTRSFLVKSVPFLRALKSLGGL